MYYDDSPFSFGPPTQSGFVVVVEPSDTDTDAVIDYIREHGATSRDYDGNEIFWVVFPDEPRRVWDFTERALRSTINRRLK